LFLNPEHSHAGQNYKAIPPVFNVIRCIFNAAENRPSEFRNSPINDCDYGKDIAKGHHMRASLGVTTQNTVKTMENTANHSLITRAFMIARGDVHIVCMHQHER